jgi:hypothetical protein
MVSGRESEILFSKFLLIIAAAYTVQQYYDRFGELPPTSIWPKDLFPRFSSNMEIGIVAPDGKEIKMVCSAADDPSSRGKDPRGGWDSTGEAASYV